MSTLRIVSNLSEVMIVFLNKILVEMRSENEELGTLDKLLSFLKDHARTLQNSKN